MECGRARDDAACLAGAAASCGASAAKGRVERWLCWAGEIPYAKLPIGCAGGEKVGAESVELKALDLRTWVRTERSFAEILIKIIELYSLTYRPRVLLQARDQAAACPIRRLLRHGRAHYFRRIPQIHCSINKPASDHAKLRETRGRQ